MQNSHVDAYFRALAGKDKAGIGQHFTQDIVLLGPIYAEAIEGRDAVVAILSGFVDTIDHLEVELTMSSGQDVAVFFGFSRDGITVKGNERLHVTEEGLIDAIEVAWRPLPAAVQIQEIFAAKMGFPAMHLTSE
ncbi:nuclear transport factor 2 family protein [Nostoc sp. 3335mG]|nr:nuclear transport factor 2 family protein [Nostoc sp. 3335mG]